MFVDKVEDLTPRRSSSSASSSTCTPNRPRACPSRSWCRPCPATSRRSSSTSLERRGGPVDLRVPVRGPKRALLRDRGVQRERRASSVTGCTATSDHNSRARALESLQRELGLPDAPLRIECYDMSHLQGSDYVGSMVVFEDGLPKKSDYRHFRVAAVDGNDDYAAMEEVLTRRLTTLADRGGRADGRRIVRPATRTGASPIRHSSCCSTGASDSSTSGSGCSTRWG